MAGNPRFIYMSFNDDGFQGACLVDAFDERSAIQRAWELGINPGGEVLCVPINPDIEIHPLTAVMIKHKNMLWSKADMVRLGLVPKSVWV